MSISTQHISGHRFSVEIRTGGQVEQHEVSGRYAQQLNRLESQTAERINNLHTEINIMKTRLNEARKNGDVNSVRSFDAAIQRSMAQIDNLERNMYTHAKNIIIESHIQASGTASPEDTSSIDNYDPLTDLDGVQSEPTIGDDLSFQKDMMQMFMDMFMQRLNLLPQQAPTQSDLQQQMFEDLFEMVKGLADQLQGDGQVIESTVITDPSPGVVDEGEPIEELPVEAIKLEDELGVSDGSDDGYDGSGIAGGYKGFIDSNFDAEKMK